MKQHQVEALGQTMIRNKKSKKGQIVVFMVLIFQMLFIFIAMVVNIGLVVHDKINLQNAVDLAAIYGAQRQAEILNAMAHVNYQIRQSYKLMAWRYFMLGNLGANYRQHNNTVRTYNINNGGPDANSVNCSYLINNCSSRRGPCGSTPINNMTCPYAVCLAHPQWFTHGITPGTGDDHRCQDMQLGASNIERPTAVIPSSLGSIAIGGPIERLILQRASRAFDNACKTMQLLNWYVAASFLYSFRYDQWKRKILAMELFNHLLARNKDIEGKEIQEGVEKTLVNNLTFVNYKARRDRDSLIKIESSVNGKKFNEYFEWQQIAPILFYAYQIPMSNNARSLCKSDLLPILQPPLNCTPSGSPTNFVSCDDHLWISSRGSELIAGTPDQPLHLSSGFYKKNTSPIYIQVRANFRYNRQIFFPTGDIILRAEAYAKPFGSGFGPPQNVDTLLPVGPFPAFPSGTTLSQGDYHGFLRFAPNHSLYPGDQQGLYNHAVQWFWTKELVSQNPNFYGKKTDNYIITNAREEDPLVIDRTPTTPGGPDLRANDSFLTKHIRTLEEKAIAPDLFDLAYYTILPDYMTTLYPKMISNTSFKNTVEAHLGGASIPGDLGFFNTSQVGMNDFSNLSQPPCYNKPPGFRLNFIQKQIDCPFPSRRSDSPFYLRKVLKTEHLLTSWSPPMQGGYRGGNMYKLGSNTHPLGKECKASNDQVDIRTPLNTSQVKAQNTLPQYCLAGGRSGFSVKLIHPNMAR